MSDKIDNPVNPIYTWEGLAMAAYIWNLGAKNSTTLNTLGGFCSENDPVKQKLTLAILLGNATVESANFMLCQESIESVGAGSNNESCSTYSRTGNNNFTARYFNNCDNVDPNDYSCLCSAPASSTNAPASSTNAPASGSTKKAGKDTCKGKVIAKSNNKDLNNDCSECKSTSTWWPCKTNLCTCDSSGFKDFD